MGLIACGGMAGRRADAHLALRAIAHSLRGWPTPLGAMLNTTMRLFDQDGTCLDLSAKFQLEVVGRQESCSLPG